MLRCHFCGRQAMAGLAHLHGLTVPLCLCCSEKVVEKLEISDCSHCKQTEQRASQLEQTDADELNLKAA